MIGKERKSSVIKVCTLPFLSREALEPGFQLLLRIKDELKEAQKS